MRHVRGQVRLISVGARATGGSVPGCKRAGPAACPPMSARTCRTQTELRPCAVPHCGLAGARAAPCAAASRGLPAADGQGGPEDDEPVPGIGARNGPCAEGHFLQKPSGAGAAAVRAAPRPRRPDIAGSPRRGCRPGAAARRARNARPPSPPRLYLPPFPPPTIPSIHSWGNVILLGMNRSIDPTPAVSLTFCVRSSSSNMPALYMNRTMWLLATNGL